MKSNNCNNYRLIKTVFMVFCKENNLKPFNNSVTWEHEQFSCVATDFEGDICYFIAVDACCAYCYDESVENRFHYCFNCGRYNQIDFEQMDILVYTQTEENNNETKNV